MANPAEAVPVEVDDAVSIDPEEPGAVEVNDVEDHLKGVLDGWKIWLEKNN